MEDRNSRANNPRGEEKWDKQGTLGMVMIIGSTTVTTTNVLSHYTILEQRAEGYINTSLIFWRTAHSFAVRAVLKFQGTFEHGLGLQSYAVGERTKNRHKRSEWEGGGETRDHKARWDRDADYVSWWGSRRERRRKAAVTGIHR